MLLIIADISGYTRYMTANAKTLSHSQTIIIELVEAIVRQIELPLEVAKLEGDAVFLFCRKRQTDGAWAAARRLIGEKLCTFFDMFSAKLSELSASTTCTCSACTHIEKLRLKIIVHSGEALFHRVLNFVELAGVDVIMVHRLLKNSVKADQYLLLTETARHDIEFPEPFTLVEGAESYEDLGRITTWIHFPGAADGKRPDSVAAPADAPSPRAAVPMKGSFGLRFKQSLRLYLKLWSGTFRRFSRDSFQHISPTSGEFARYVFAALTLILSPLMLPVGTFFVLRKALQTNPVAADHAAHPADCQCGNHSH